MRILQLIDSLEAGGAERMAVNYANVLSEKIILSALVVTRQEGILKEQLSEKVSYLFLNKKRTMDLKSIFRLRSFVCKHKIDIVHAHGTSFFQASLLKLIHPQIKIIWHEHYGARVDQARKDNLILFFFHFFSSVFVVNYQLVAWVKKHFFLNKVYYIPNFVIVNHTSVNHKLENSTLLNGNNEKRIVCVANLKKPKNHFALLTAFKEMRLAGLGWTLHLVGNDYKDNYSTLLKDFIKENNLEKFIFIYGSKNDIQHIMKQATIGVLASTAEGFPLVLLEFGLSKVPVICSNVGYCSEIIKDNVNGLLFNPLDSLQMQNQFSKMISDKSLREKLAVALNKSVVNYYSESKVLDILLLQYKQIL